MQKIKIQLYTTGWDKVIQKRNNTLYVGMHAPAELRFEITEPLKLFLGLEKDGIDRASKVLNNNGKEIPIKTGESKIMEPGQVTFKSIVDVKYKCWNYLLLENCEVEAERDFYFNVHNRLGDAFCVLTGLENHARWNGIPELRVGGSMTFKEVIDLFDFERIKFTPVRIGQKHDDIFDASSWRVFWPERFIQKYYDTYGYKQKSEVVLPKLRQPIARNVGETILCQFDARSAGIWPQEKIARAVKMLRDFGFSPVIIGGKDTKNYIPDIEYRLGDLQFIIRELLGCKFFVGCDSGIAHLAGVLGIKSFVFNGAIIDIEATEAFFRYKNTIVINRDLVETPELLTPLFKEKGEVATVRAEEPTQEKGNQTPLFLCCQGRSGSTLLMRLLNAYDGVDLQGENNGLLIDLFRFNKGLLACKKAEFVQWKNDFNVFKVQTKLRELIQEVLNKNNSPIWGCKEIRYGYLPDAEFNEFCDFLLSFYDNSKIIFLVRKIETIINSGWWKITDKPLLQAMEKRFVTYAKNKPRCFFLNYEDILECNQNYLSLYDFLGLKFDQAKHDATIKVRIK